MIERFEAAAIHPMTLVTAPAGAGKTTALVHFARSCGRPHGWYRAEATEAEPATMLAHVRRALDGVLEHHLDDWPDADAAVRSLATVGSRPRTLLFIDDLHELCGSRAEDALERLVRNLPPWLSIVAATRRTPDCNLPDLLVSEVVVELADDVLRWRPWEVERLFRDFHRLPLRPEEAARLTQRTEGWAAGLQLFHLASRDLPTAGRRDLIDDLHTRPGLVRAYLARNVLAGLPDDLRRFMVDTCVLGRLDAEVCDRLRGADDSDEYLADLRRRRLFVVPRADGRGLRYHEVLRTHLETSLHTRDGPATARRHHLRAGALLEEEGSVGEALHAYIRAEAWDDAARLLGTDGRMLVSGGSRVVLEQLPTAMVDSDPWLQLIAARSLVGDGRLAEATAAYRRAEQAFGRLPGADVCRRERVALSPWLDVTEQPRRILTDVLRMAVRRNPRRRAREAATRDGPRARLVAGVALLLAGAVDEAADAARDAGTHPDAEVFTMAAATAVEHVARIAGGRQAPPTELLRSAEIFEQLGATWLARLVRAISGCRSRAAVDETEALQDMARERDDAWGGAVLALVAGLAAIVHGPPRPDLLEQAAERFRGLDAGTLESWARSLQALAAVQCGEADARAMAEQARSMARRTGVPGAEAVAESALAALPGADAGAARLRADALTGELGLALPGLQAAPVRARVVASREAPSEITCLGGLAITIAHRVIDPEELKPQAHTVLALLAASTGKIVHRQRLMAALWPHEDPDVARARLPVLVSTVRRHLEPDVEAGSWSLLVGHGDGYRLQVPEGTWVDVTVFDDAVAAARRARHDGNRTAEMQFLGVAVDAYGGPLLPEFGPAEWIVEEREHYRLQFARATEALGAWHLGRGEAAAAVDLARGGLRADRYRSRLWHLLVRGHRAVGDEVAATRASEQHAAVMAELGVTIG